MKQNPNMKEKNVSSAIFQFHFRLEGGRSVNYRHGNYNKK